MTHLDGFRRIDTVEELEQVDVGTIIIEEPDAHGEAYTYRLEQWSCGFATHDWELRWVGFGSEEPYLVGDIEFPVYVIWEPAWGRQSALTADQLQPVRVDHTPEETAAHRDRAEQIIRDAQEPSHTTTNFYACLDCHTLIPIKTGEDLVCPDCGSWNLELEMI